MELTIAKQDLARVLSRAASVVNNKSPMPILQNVVLDASAGGLTVRGTDLYLGIETRAQAEVKKPGSIAVDAKRAAEVAKALGAGDVRLKLDGNHLTVKSGRSSFKLGTIPVDDFPSIPTLTEDTKRLSRTSARALSTAIRQGSYAMDMDDDGKPQAHALFVLEPTRIGVYSATNKGLGSAFLATECTEHDRFVLPAKAIGHVRALLDAVKDGDVEIARDGSLVFFVAGDVTMSVKLGDLVKLHDSFTMFWSMESKKVAGKTGRRVELHRESVLDSVKRVSVISSADKVSGSVLLSFATGQLVIRSTSAATGDEGADLIECNADFEHQLDLNPKQLTDALSSIDDDDIAMGFYGDISAVLFTGAKSENSQHIVMPFVQKKV